MKKGVLAKLKLKKYRVWVFLQVRYFLTKTTNHMSFIYIVTVIGTVNSQLYR